MGRRARRVVLVLLAATLVGGAAATATVPPAPRVTLIGDSIPVPITTEPEARATLAQGIDLDIEAAVCRKIDTDSCPARGVRPPNVIDLVHALGASLGPTVIISVGYNDDSTSYAAEIEHTLVELRAAGVVRVLWTTLKVDRQAYADMNDAIVSAASRHPELAVVDWNAAAQGHPEWFQPDGLHPNDEGAKAMARVLHAALVQAGVTPASGPLHVTTRALPGGRVGGLYDVTLRAAGGTPPYRWSMGVAAPSGLHLKAAGLLRGIPTKQRKETLVLRVTDAGGTSSTLRLPIWIRAATRQS